LKIIGAAEDELDTGPELTFYSLDDVVHHHQINLFFFAPPFAEVKQFIRSIKSHTVGLDDFFLKFINS
jgi:hypothetical protein